MSDIKELRDKIDAIDEKMLSLFVERMCIAEEIVEYKRKNNLAILNSSREKEVIDKSLKRLVDKKFEPYVIKYLKFIMTLSKEYQKELID